ncbi:MAG: NAD(P)/FAD-dependent oxidoreductase [Candidatus Omnitrophota bacterium]|nr:NAD(P)/FAD-dependent oxidoreductase [Candidatus Omnitrophota bacterium]
MVRYDIAVIGGGAGGAMAAIRAGQRKKRVLLIERNDSIGRKILITGKGRCNITNAADINVFIDKFGKQGEFLRTAFHAFSGEDLMDFFKSLGLETKVERQGRVFPVTDKAKSVTEALVKALSENGVEILYNSRVTEIAKDGGCFKLATEDAREIRASKVVLATGGASYKITGSSGDGFNIAKKLGHRIAPLTPGLVPLTVKEAWIKELQGVALEHIKITFEYGKKRLISDVGELMFTHFGVSGPLVLDMSSQVTDILKENKIVRLFIDLKPGLREEQLESKLLHKFKIKGNIILKNLMKDIMPQRLVERFLKLINILGECKTNQVTQGQRRAIIAMLKAFPLTITGSLPIEEAMVTGGGISIKEINPRTMESKIVAGLYFAGEVIEGAAASGGYNLQQAFSTGYLAGEKAALGLAEVG